MKILHVLGDLGTGGAEKLIIETIPLFVQKGNVVDVLLLNGAKTPFYKQLEATHCCNIFSLGKSFYNPIYIFKIIPYLSKYDIIHVHLFPAQYFVVFAKVLSFLNAKLIFTEHSTGNKRLNNPKFKALEKFIYSYYQKVICISEQVKQTLMNKVSLAENKFITIENGVNLQVIEDSRKANRTDFGFRAEDKLMLMVGGFRSEKDQDTIIKTVSLLPEMYKLILVGDGERRTELEQLVKDLQLSERVLFLGLRLDVYSLMKMSDIVILSSHWEGFGLVAVEAMACGIPLIASNVEGLAQVVENGGILFEGGDEKSLKAKIQLLENESFYEDIRASGIIKAKQYDISKMVDQTIKVYSQLLN